MDYPKLSKIEVKLIDSVGNHSKVTIDYDGYVNGKLEHDFNLVEDVIQQMVIDYEQTKHKIPKTNTQI
jgi:ribosomal protein S6